MRVTRKRWCSSTSMPGEQGVEVGLDDLVEQDEPHRLDLEQARQDLRHLDPGEAALAGLRVAQADRDRQAQGRDVRERMTRIDRERRQDREDLVEEPLAERLVMLGDRRVVDELDAFRGERAADRHEDRRMVGDELEDARTDRRQLLVGGPAVGGAGDLAGLDLLAQAGDPDLEELVEVAGEDGQELDPLEQRVALVARLVEHAGVELEPGQLAVEVRVGRRLRPGGTSRAWQDRGSSGCAWFDRGHRGCLRPLQRGRSTETTRPARIARHRAHSSGHVPPVAVRRIEPDAHPLAGGRVDEDLVAAPEAWLEARPGRFAAGPAGRVAAAVRGRRAIAHALDERRRR